MAHGIVWLPHSHFPNGTMNLTLIDSQRIWLNQYGPNFDFDVCPNAPSISCKGRKPFIYFIFFGTMAWASNFRIEIAMVKDIMIGWKNRWMKSARQV